MDNRSTSSTIVNIALSASAIIACLLIAKTIDLAQTKDVILSACLFIGFLSATVSLWDIWLDRKKSFEMERLIADLEATTPRRETPRWLMREQDVVRMELGCQTTEILVITPDFAKNTVFEDVVRANLSRGVQYTFVYLEHPTNELLSAKIDSYAQVVGCKKPRRIAVPKDEFQLLAVTEIVIYNPRMNAGEDPIMAAMELPGIPYWIRLGEGPATSLSARFYKFTNMRGGPAPEIATEPRTPESGNGR